MNERQLREKILVLAGRRPPAGENGADPPAAAATPFVEAVLEIHPEGYEEARAAAVAAVLGEPDKIYRPALGAPHVDIYRYPPTAERKVWCYLSNGMSDLPQIRDDGSQVRTEVLACTREASVLAVDLVHLTAVRPFRLERAQTTEVFELETGSIPGFRHLLVAAGGPLPSLRTVQLADPAMRIETFAITAMSPEDSEFAATHGIEEVLAEVGDDPLFWILDERFGLEPSDEGDEPEVDAAIRGSACLEEATASPCPRCGGSLREDRLDDVDDPFLVCRACGWSRTESALEHVAPYRWALDRLRLELGAEQVDWDVRPDGEGVVLRVNAPRRPPALVELRSPIYDINRSDDRTGELEAKLVRLREFLAAGD